MKETKYGICAVNVVKFIMKDCQNLSENRIKSIWLNEMKKLTNSEDSIKKCCPRKTITGLILNNKTIINSENNGNFRSKNYDYAQFILQNHLNVKSPILKTDKLNFWKIIQHEFPNAPKNQNGQLDVLIALYKHELLRF